MKSQELWGVSAKVNREAEEGAAALLERLFGNPAVVYAEESKPWSVATVYVRQSSAQVHSRREALEAGVRFLEKGGLDIGPARIVIRKVRHEDWAHSWKKHFKPIQIGGALLIKPSWSKRRAERGQATVVLDPGLSFGTGQHPTTAFCLNELVQARIIGHPQSFLDIGVGSGILAISAAKLGYRPVRAIDLDPVSIRVAKANARTNRADHRIQIVREDLRQAPLEVRFKYDLICANLIDDLLVEQRDRILNRLRPGGRLVLAGVLAEQFRRVRTSYEAAGMRLARTKIQGEWQSAAFLRVSG